MCLAVPGKIIELHGEKATVDFDGIKRQVDVSLIESVHVDDYVLVHVGFAIQTVDKDTAQENYRLLSEMDKVEID